MRLATIFTLALCSTTWLGCDTTSNVGDTPPACVPSDEVCDGIDNNCDGDIDEGFDVGEACSSGLGACESAGVLACGDDGAAVCDAAVIEPSEELCDGIDNNCDGTIDDGFNVGDACSGGVGTCASEGVISCSEDGTASLCDAVAGEPSAELCDGLDNDCDGDSDEDFNLGDACESGVGACLSAGVNACGEDGAVICDAPVIEPTEELCDGIDNNCDGDADETFNVGEACEAGIGACLAQGALACTDDGGIACNAVPGAPSEELCDGIDNNCDGDTDESYNVGSACRNGVGACVAEGQFACQNDGTAACNAVPGDPSEELCDGIDNNCDGDTDEPFNVGGECSNGVGACEAAGAIACLRDGTAACNAVPGDPTEERCDGVDNNCDGDTDEPFNVGRECSNGVGACEAAGEIACLRDGTAACNAVAGDPSDEICDAADNDCDGDTDEGFRVGAACSSSLGECSNEGEIACLDDGTASCNAAEPVVAEEICDDVDNDCDGWIDERCDRPGMLSGIQTGGVVSELQSEGWEVCHRSAMNTRNHSLQEVLSDCEGAQLMMACGEVNADQLTLNASGTFAGVTTVVENNSTGSHQHNGATWYYNESRSWGFAPADEAVSRNTCDTNNLNADGETRMCIHTENGNIGAGFRCGNNRLNASADWERLILRRTGQFSFRDELATRVVRGEGNHDGVLQAYVDGAWGYVCDDVFDRNNNAAIVSCRQMGYDGGSHSNANTGTNEFALDDVSCASDQFERLTQCTSTTRENCSASEGVRLTCDGGSRLVRRNGDNERTGILEVYAQGTWGPVCDDGFDGNLNGAEVACKEMGYPGALRQLDVRSANNNFKLDNVQCVGNEHDLLDCPRYGNSQINQHNCSTTEAVGLECLAWGACRNDSHCDGVETCVNGSCELP